MGTSYTPPFAENQMIPHLFWPLWLRSYARYGKNKASFRIHQFSHFPGHFSILNGHFMRHYFPLIFPLLVALLDGTSAYGATTAPLPTETPVISALPDGVEYTDGAAAHTKIITQTDNNSLRSVIDWQSFNIGKDAEVIFKSANKSHVTVNRVVGGGTDPSRIYGRLTADGIVVILDPNGVFFSNTAVIDVGGIVAATGQLANKTDFENGADMLLADMDAVSGAMVQNNATQFTIRDAGLAAFVAPAVQNNGIITARLGHVSLASGKAATLDFCGDGMLKIAVTEGLAAALPHGRAHIDNKGKIIAPGGTVQMTARAAAAAIDTVINSDGLVVATHAEGRDGKIILSNGKTPKRTLTNAVRVGKSSTIQNGLDAATENTTVYVNGGFYSESLQITKPLTLTTFDSAGVAVFGRSGAAAESVVTVTAPNVTIDGLSLQEGFHGLFADHADGLDIRHITFKNSFSHGVYLRNTLPDSDIEHSGFNVFSGIGGKNVFVEGAATNDGPDNRRVFNTPAFGGFAAAPLVIEQAGIDIAALAALSPAAGDNQHSQCAEASSCAGNMSGRNSGD